VRNGSITKTPRFFGIGVPQARANARRVTRAAYWVLLSTSSGLSSCAQSNSPPTTGEAQGAAGLSGAGFANGGSDGGGTDSGGGGVLASAGTGGVESGVGGVLGSAGENANDEAGSGGARSGGAAGVSGSAGSGASVGGAAGVSGVAGTGASGGGAGSGVRCADHPLTAKTTWVVTASSSNTNEGPARAIDGNLATRWSTGVSQDNDWFQVDFGTEIALSSVTLRLGSNLGDYPRAYQARLSDAPNDFALTPIVMGSGQQGVDTVLSFPPAVGRYLLISQVGIANGVWWSIAELLAACSP
jgi:hypothetical protein